MKFGSLLWQNKHPAADPLSLLMRLVKAVLVVANYVLYDIKVYSRILWLLVAMLSYQSPLQRLCAATPAITSILFDRASWRRHACRRLCWHRQQTLARWVVLGRIDVDDGGRSESSPHLLSPTGQASSPLFRVLARHFLQAEVICFYFSFQLVFC